MKSILKFAEFGAKHPISAPSFSLILLFFLIYSPHVFGQGSTCGTAQLVPPGTYFADGPASGGGAISLCTLLSTGTNADWYKYTAPADGLITIGSCYGFADTRLSVFTGICGAMTCYSSGDDDCAVNTNPGSYLFASKIENLSVSAGTTYYIQWDDYWSSLGFIWSLSFIPANDECSTAQQIEVDAGAVSGSNNGALPDPTYSITCGFFGEILVQHGVWYRFIAPNNRGVIIEILAGSFYGSQIQIYDECNGSVIACDEGGELNPMPKITFPCDSLYPGEDYYILVDGWDGDYGTFDISITSTACAAPANDLCIDAQPIAINASPIEGTNSGATSDALQNSLCGTSQHGVWYSFVAPYSEGKIIVDAFAGLLHDTQIEVFDACGGESIACDDDGGLGLESKLTLPCDTYISGHTYYIQVDGYSGSAGTFTISVTTEPCPPPPNDACADAIPLIIHPAGNCPANQVVGTTSGAASESPDACESYTNDVYYSVTTGDSQDSISIDLTQISATDLVLSIFEGSCSAAADTCLINQEASVIYSVNANTTYYIRVHSLSTLSSGSFNICVQTLYDCNALSANIGDACDDGNPNTENDVVTSSCSCLGAPLNDLCSNATPLTINAAGNCPTNQVVGTTSGAASESPNACESSMSDVYYSVTTSDSQESISIDLTQITATDLVLSIFEGSCSAESDFCAFNPAESVIYPVIANTTYYIRVHSFFTLNTGTFNICVQEVYDCPSLSANIGDACDDSNPTTGNDTVTPACTCEGTSLAFASIGGTVTGWNTDCSERALTLSLYDAFEGVNYLNLVGTLHSDGSFDLAGAPNILPGDYHVLIKVEGALTQALFNVEIESGVNSLNFDPLILGDLNDDNTISVFDFSEMNPAFGTSLGDSDYNPNADLNCDGLINVFDVSILNTNYGAVGESIFN